MAGKDLVVIMSSSRSERWHGFPSIRLLIPPSNAMWPSKSSAQMPLSVMNRLNFSSGSSAKQGTCPTRSPLHPEGPGLWRTGGNTLPGHAFVEGGTLKEKMGRPMPYREAAALLAPIARALEYAHPVKDHHRDVKPANILISRSGAPILSDFGSRKCSVRMGQPS